MKQKISWPFMMKVVLIIIFFSGPVIILSGYSVYALRNWLAEVHDIEVTEDTYLWILLLCMCCAMWLSIRKIMAEIRDKIKEDKNDKDKGNAEF